MTAIGVWVGGLFWLLLGLPRPRRGRAARPPCGVFTRVATAVLVVVLATGLVRALVEVGSVSALFDTDYGITLLVKIVWSPAWSGSAPSTTSSGCRRGEAGGDGADRRFGLNSRGELAVALCVLAATAVLSGLAPAGPPRSPRGPAAAGQVTASGHDYATAVRATLTLTPGVAGRNDYVLWVDDYDTGDPLKTVTAVSMKCSLPERARPWPPSP